MAEKILNTRIQLKHDTYANWDTKNPVLKKGEIGICEVPVGGSASGADQTTKPAILFKVGDGTSNWKALPWASALAADVYSWAKAANKPSYDYSEITGTPTIPTDTNTTYRLLQDTEDGHKFTLQSQEKGTTSWTNVTTITIPDNDTNTDHTYLFAEGTQDGKFEVKDVLGNITYNIPVHNVATRKYVDEKTAGLTGAMHLVGKATANIVDGSTADPVIAGYDFAKVAKGDVVLGADDHKEFVWTGAKWEVLGDESSYALKTITAAATDDDVVVLTGTSGSNGVTYDAKHAKKGPAGGAVKGPAADVTVSGSGATGSIKVPKVTVDEYGHTTGLTEQTLSITMPTVPVAATETPKDLGTANVGTSAKYAREDHVHKKPNIDELSQTADTYLILDCGTASKNI